MNAQQKLIALAAWNTVTCFACSLALAVSGDTAFSYITLALAVASSTDLTLRLRRTAKVANHDQALSDIWDNESDADAFDKSSNGRQNE